MIASAYEDKRKWCSYDDLQGAYRTNGSFLNDLIVRAVIQSTEGFCSKY